VSTLQDLEGSIRQLECRCTELREAGATHEHRAAEAAAELGRSNHVIERLSGDLQTSKDKLKRKQIIIVRQACPNKLWLMFLAPLFAVYSSL
jgi:chromosome segregation ATPase